MIHFRDLTDLASRAGRMANPPSFLGIKLTKLDVKLGVKPSMSGLEEGITVYHYTRDWYDIGRKKLNY